MNRRRFLTTAAATMIPSLGLAYPSVPYAPTTWPELQGSSDRIILNWRAGWSITCQIKGDLINALIDQNPDYGRLTFVDVDWDTFGPSVLAQKLKVERRSTLIAFNGTQEITRIVNEPYEHRMRKFLDAAVAA